MRLSLKYILISVFGLIISSQAISQQLLDDSTVDPNPHRMDWWKAAKFGMFIHWGIYSVPAGKYNDDINQGEWIMNRSKIPLCEYKKYAEKFNPVKFNAEEWVLLAKAAGQKYIVITAKHHDGFAMYKSAVSDYNIYDATPFKRDPLKELAEACRKYNMKLGFYYSQAQDWSHKGGAINGKMWDKEAQEGSMDEYIDQIAVPQVKEILSNYGDVAVLWWDTPQSMNTERAQKLHELLKLQPQIISNNRLGGGYQGDLATPEQYMPPTGWPGKNWELCQTINGHWGYNAYDDNWKTTKELLLKLVDVAGKGGNYLLNVGPTAEGIIPPVCAKSLKEIGEWLSINGESIYETTASPFNYLSWGSATRRGNKIYLHVNKWPADGRLIVPIKSGVQKAYLLQDADNSLKIKRSKERVVINLPRFAPDKIVSVLVVEIEGEPDVFPMLTLNKKAIASSELKEENSVMKLFDNNPKSIWCGAKGSDSAFVEIDLEKLEPVAGFAFAEPYRLWNNKTQGFKLEYKNGDTWEMISSGKTKGVGYEENFTPIKARYIRLTISNKEESPRLNEWTLRRPE